MQDLDPFSILHPLSGWGDIGDSEPHQTQRRRRCEGIERARVFGRLGGGTGDDATKRSIVQSAAPGDRPPGFARRPVSSVLLGQSSHPVGRCAATCWAYRDD